MRRLFKKLIAAALIALAPSIAVGRTTDALILFGKPKPALDLNFTLGALPSGVTFTRASTATDSFYTDAAASSFNSYSSGVPRLLPTGFLSEEPRTQSLLNSAAPVTQTTGSLGTGTYVFWCIGTGSTTSTAGTATASGLGAITCSQGTFQTIIVTVAGTLTFTKSGTINRFQLELGSFPTSFISSAGATATRAGDVATVTLSSTSIPANPSAITIIGRLRSPVTNSSANVIALALSDGTSNNRLALFRNLSSLTINQLGVAGGVNQENATIASPSNGQSFQFWITSTASSFSGQIIGNSKITGIPATGAMPTGLTKLDIGTGQTDTQQWNSIVTRLQIYTLRLSDGRASAIAGGL